MEIDSSEDLTRLKSSRLSKLSFWSALSGLLLFLLGIGVLILYLWLYPRHTDRPDPILNILVYTQTIVLFICGLAAVVLFIAAEAKQKPRWGYALTGLLLGMLEIVVALFCYSIISFNPHGHGYAMSRVRMDACCIATALESYYIDHHMYPLPDYDQQGKPILPHILTTPVAYITTLPHDRFKNHADGYYEYGVHNSTAEDTCEGWIISSYGPDEKDGNSGVPGGRVLDESKAWSDKALGFDLKASDLTYDPSNGAWTSSGDMWRRGP